MRRWPWVGYPKVRWREADTEMAILRELDSCRMPTPKIAQWFRGCLSAAFDDVSQAQGQRKKTLVKRKSELANMQDRLLKGCLASTVDKVTSAGKSAVLKQQAEEVARQLGEADRCGLALGQATLNAFDLSQNLVEIWHGSNFAARRKVMECVSLNRTLGDVTLGLPKKEPFDLLAKRLFLGKTRGSVI